MPTMTLLVPEVLKEEITRFRERVGKGEGDLDARREFEKNVYPILSMMVDTFASLNDVTAERLDLAEQAIAEYLTEQESMILPDLAQHLVATITLGLMICKKLAELRGCTDPEQAAPIAVELDGMASAYATAATHSLQAIGEVTLDDGEEEEEEPEEPAQKAPEPEVNNG